MRGASCLLILGLILCGPAFAEERMPVDRVCGPAPEEVSETEKGNLDAKAQTLLKIGSGELQGAAEKVKREIMVNQSRSDAARQLFYLKRISCVLLYQDTTLTTDDKLKRIRELETGLLNQMNPRSETASPPQVRCESVRPQIDIRWGRENADNGKFVIYFDYGDTNLGLEAIGNLQSFIMGYYRDHPGISVSVIGYADAVGAEEDQGISEKRANAVVKALIDLGVARDRIKAAGRGPCGLHVATLAGVREAQNRLVEIIFHY